MKARFLSTADAELAEAVDYYTTIHPGLGLKFLVQVEAAVRLIETHPEAWLPVIAANSPLPRAALSVRPALPTQDQRDLGPVGDGPAPRPQTLGASALIGVTLKDFYHRHGLKVPEDEALQSNPRFWELIESARTAGKG